MHTRFQYQKLSAKSRLIHIRLSQHHSGIEIRTKKRERDSISTDNERREMRKRLKIVEKLKHVQEIARSLNHSRLPFIIESWVIAKPVGNCLCNKCDSSNGTCRWKALNDKLYQRESLFLNNIYSIQIDKSSATRLNRPKKSGKRSDEGNNV